MRRIILSVVAIWLVIPATLDARAIEIRDLPETPYGHEDPYYQVLQGVLLVQSSPSPVLVFIRSGGWRSRPGGRPASAISRAFNDAGFSTVFVVHRTVEKYSWPAQIEDVSLAIQFIRSKASEWNIDPERISVTGRSSGGHLALMAGFLPDRANKASHDPVRRHSSGVQCVIAGSGPTDLELQMKQLVKPEVRAKARDVGPQTVPTVLKLVGLGPDEMGSEESYRRLRDISPIRHVGRDAPPVFMQYAGPEGVRDPNDPLLQWSVHSPISGLLLVQKLKDLDVPYELFMVEDLNRRRDELLERQIAFLKRHNGMP